MPTNYVDNGYSAIFELCARTHKYFLRTCDRTRATQLNNSVNFDINKRRTIARVATGGPYASLGEKEGKSKYIQLTKGGGSSPQSPPPPPPPPSPGYVTGVVLVSLS